MEWGGSAENKAKNELREEGFVKYENWEEEFGMDGGCDRSQELGMWDREEEMVCAA